jgi:hypothetical protein
MRDFFSIVRVLVLDKFSCKLIFCLVCCLIFCFSCSKKKEPQIQLPSWIKTKNNGYITFLDLYLGADGSLIDPADKNIAQTSLKQSSSGSSVIITTFSYSFKTKKATTQEEIANTVGHYCKKHPACQNGIVIKDVYQKSEYGGIVYVVSGYCKILERSNHLR